MRLRVLKNLVSILLLIANIQNISHSNTISVLPTILQLSQKYQIFWENLAAPNTR